MQKPDTFINMFGIESTRLTISFQNHILAKNYLHVTSGWLLKLFVLARFVWCDASVTTCSHIIEQWKLDLTWINL